MVEVQRHGHGVVRDGALGDFGDKVIARELDVGRGDLDDAGHAVLLEGVHDRQRHLHVGGVERGKHHIVVVRDLDEVVHVKEGHGVSFLLDGLLFASFRSLI